MSKPVDGGVLGGRIGAILLSEGLISERTLQRALELQKQSGGRLGEVLISMGALSAAQFYRALAKQLQTPFCDLKATTPDSNALKLFTAAEAKSFRAIPLFIRGNTIDVAVENPTDLNRLEAIRAKTGYRVFPHLAVPEDIDQALRLYYEIPDAEAEPGNGKGKDFASQEVGVYLAQSNEGRVDDTPAVAMVDNLLLEAARRGSSDIHIEPFPDKTTVRFRIDGVLESAGDFPRMHHEAIITRLKVLGGMDVAEKRLPLDGRFSTIIDNRRYDLRLSTLPTIFGEKAVIRLLEQTTEHLDFARLGLSPDVMEKLQKALALPHGLIIVGGPTGSGKSTTLATALNTVNTPGKNIVTVEDPVEYIIPGVNHTQVNIKAGLNFATVIRHILRQDPDVIMVGEIRDSETAEMAFRAALTGHLVLTTIHANDALSVLTRLEDMGVNKYLALTSMVAMFSQRLVRTICPWCKYTETAPAQVIEEVKNAAGIDNGIDVTVASTTRPCVGCPDRAYKRRTAISEIILVDDNFRRRYLESGDPKSDPLLNPARRHEGLLADGARKVIQGLTTWDEVLSVFRTSQD
ncbi:MAG TPA: Flp pilus assembly complex ATPase component TadA [Firmicutes bacterium]|nr:Flp pilus assembly complex ATPase component TadA [Candidatus Fermentithermobacillaceae bacterium]